MIDRHAALDVVARERRDLASTEAPSLESTVDFVRELMAGGGVQVVAVNETNTVVGWCDVTRKRWEGVRHVGTLGMGLLPPYRGQGYGRELAEAAIQAARQRGIERIELEVFASNVVAARLYEALGFRREGLKRRFRRLDGVDDDAPLLHKIPAIQATEHHHLQIHVVPRRAGDDFRLPDSAKDQLTHEEQVEQARRLAAALGVGG
jgi:RimJ/RimL family protein N-acetyltransferase